MRKLIVALALFVGATVPLFSQPALTLVWDMENTTVSMAQGYTYKYYLDGLAPTILQAVNCTSVNNITTCTAPLPPPSNGTHTIQLTASDAYYESDKSAAFTFKYPSLILSPTNLRIVR